MTKASSEVTAQMLQSIHNCRRFAAAAQLTRALVRAVADSAVVWSQSPVVLSTDCVVWPDCAVLRLREDRYTLRLPAFDDVLLVVELDSAIAAARTAKTRAYAEAGIPECWIVDPMGRRVEVHCLPEQKTYRLTREVRENDLVSPRFLAGCRVRLAELFLPAMTDKR